MTPPDKTLEELARQAAENVAASMYGWCEGGSAGATEAIRFFNTHKNAFGGFIHCIDERCKPPILAALQSATAAQQREVERLQEQLRTEREKYKELFMKAQDLVRELKE